MNCEATEMRCTIRYSQNVSKAKILATFSLNKDFCDLIGEVIHLDVCIINTHYSTVWL